jgi:hypothetical protein
LPAAKQVPQRALPVVPSPVLWSVARSALQWAALQAQPQAEF